jgi:hypothetical protein
MEPREISRNTKEVLQPLTNNSLTLKIKTSKVKFY